MTVQAPVDLGTEFLGYRIEALVGRGGMGVVYRALDLRLKRRVALKFITPELASDERFRRRFLRESELAASLDHPHVVPIYDAGEANERLYLAMRYVEGTDLRSLLRASGPLAPARTVAICRQVARALDAAHADGLVHRDVKPSNVLLDAMEHVYLADFGLTRRHAEEGAFPGDGRSLGTLGYLAPEQIEGAGADARADVYALGCLLFECLTGEPPFPGDSALAVAWAHLEEEPPAASARNADLPHALDGVLATALAKEPANRHRSCEGLVDAAEDALGLRRTPVVTRRRVALAVAAALAAVAAIVGVVAAVSGRGTGATFAARPNTLVRIDAEKNAVAGTVDVGRRPVATAAYGTTAWVYNEDDGTVSEIDGRRDEVRRVTRVRATPLDLGVYAGPVLAADARGAWLLGADANGVAVLTRVLSGGRGSWTMRLLGEPRGVAVGAGSVWVIVQTSRRDQVEGQLLRIDSGRRGITARRQLAGTTAAGGYVVSMSLSGQVFDRRPLFPPGVGVSADGIAVAHGAVWVVSSPDAVLYRFDPHSLRWTGGIDVGEGAARPIAEPSGIALGLANSGGVSVGQSGTRIIGWWSGEPDTGLSAGANGSAWSYDKRTGSVLRWASGPSPILTLALVATPPAFDGPCLTSIASWADTVWVSVAASVGGACP